MNPSPNSDFPSDIVRRISMSADQLYEEGGRTAYPNVDAVRRRARADMNTTSSVMRAWRRAQTGTAAPLPASIPSTVQGASQSLLAAVWAAATDSAHANLQTAQTGWEQERTEAEACRQQLATAFDGQTEELAIAQRELDAMRQVLAAQGSELQAAAANVEKLRQEAAEASGWAATAEARANEVVKRADDLKAELTRAHASADQERIDSKRQLESAQTMIAQLREEVQKKSAQEHAFREELARLHGQIDAIATERQAMLAALKPNGQDVAAPKRRQVSKTRDPNGA